MFSNFEIKIASVPHREELVAEVYYNHEQWVEISQENDQLVIQFYPQSNKGFWEFSFNEAVEILEKAKKKLLAMDEKRSFPSEKSE